MNFKLKKLIVILIFGVFYSVILVFWILWYPFNQTKIRRAVPTNAIFISEHYNLSSRINLYLQSPLGKLLEKVLNEEKILIKDKKLKWIIDSLTKNLCITGIFPGIKENTINYIIVSYAGYRAAITQWLLELKILKNFEKLKVKTYTPVWIYTKSLKESVLYLTIRDGIIICGLLHSEELNLLPFIGDIKESPLFYHLDNSIYSDIHSYDRFAFYLFKSNYPMTGTIKCISTNTVELTISTTESPLCSITSFNNITYPNVGLLIKIPVELLLKNEYLKSMPQGEKILIWLKQNLENNSAIEFSIYDSDEKLNIYGIPVPAILISIHKLKKNEKFLIDFLDILNSILPLPLVAETLNISDYHKPVRIRIAKTLLLDLIANTDYPMIIFRNSSFVISNSKFLITKGNINHFTNIASNEIALYINTHKSIKSVKELLLFSATISAFSSNQKLKEYFLYLVYIINKHSPFISCFDYITARFVFHPEGGITTYLRFYQ